MDDTGLWIEKDKYFHNQGKVLHKSIILRQRISSKKLKPTEKNHPRSFFLLSSQQSRIQPSLNEYFITQIVRHLTNKLGQEIPSEITQNTAISLPHRFDRWIIRKVNRNNPPSKNSKELLQSETTRRTIMPIKSQYSPLVLELRGDKSPKKQPHTRKK